VSLRSFKRVAKGIVRAGSVRWHSVGRITRDLTALGVRSGAVLMVHSSLSSLGYVPGGPKGVIKALLTAIGCEGTLVMPTHTWDRPGRGDFRFDVRATPSCVGAITEVFRKMPGVLRSLHPTHSVAAFGPWASFITELHYAASTPCGPGTPYAKLLDAHGQILFLGTTFEQNTALHSLESIADVAYLLEDNDETFTVTDADGVTRPMQFRRHRRGPERRFQDTRALLEKGGAVRTGKVAESDSLLVESAPMAALILAEVRRNPDYLLAQD